ncbi:MAG: hypothetical protein WC518_04045, partial [Patescibacteria group bacterium]
MTENQLKPKNNIKRILKIFNLVFLVVVLTALVSVEPAKSWLGNQLSPLRSTLGQSATLIKNDLAKGWAALKNRPGQVAGESVQAGQEKNQPASKTDKKSFQAEVRAWGNQLIGQLAWWKKTIENWWQKEKTETNGDLSKPSAGFDNLFQTTAGNADTKNSLLTVAKEMIQPLPSAEVLPTITKQPEKKETARPAVIENKPIKIVERVVEKVKEIEKLVYLDKKEEPIVPANNFLENNNFLTGIKGEFLQGDNRFGGTLSFAPNTIIDFGGARIFNWPFFQQPVGAGASGGGSSSGSSASGVTDHGALTGLSDDDHTQYGALAQNETVSGAWTFTGDVDISSSTIDSLTVNGEHFVDLTGLGLANDNYSLRVNTSTLGLTTSEITEGSSQYFTNARVASYISSSSTIAFGGCASGQILKWNGSAWACAADDTLAGGETDPLFTTWNGYLHNRFTSVNATTTNADNLVVYSALTLPNNSITDAMLANDITASNYLSLSSYFATTTWAGGNNNLVVSGNVTSTSLWLGGAGTANNLDMTNDLYVADDVEIDGSLWVQSATTTDSLYVGGYASTTGGLYSQGNLHIGGTASFDGLVSGAGLTLAQQNFWNTTSTWAGFVANFNSNLNNTTTWAAYDANWVRNYNATTTLKDFTPSDYLSFTVWYSSTTREAMRLNGQVASYYTDATNLTVEVTDNWTGQFNGQASTYYATSSGLSTKLAVSEFETYFNSSLNTTTTLDLTTLAVNNLTVNTTIALPNNSITDAMLANDITASNYLSLSSYFATTTWAGGNNNLVVSGNVTSTGSLWVSNIATLATTTMAMGSKIGSADLNYYVMMDKFLVPAGGDYAGSIFPVWKSYIDLTWQGTPVGLLKSSNNFSDSVAILEDADGNVNPSFSFANYDVTDTADIEYATKTDQLLFTGASGGYTFDDDLSVTGSATTTVRLVVGTTNPTNNWGKLWAGGDLFINGITTSTSLWLGGAGTANNLDMTNDLYVADDVEIDGSLWVQSATTTDSLYVGGYASTTGGLYSQGNLHIGGTASFDGLVSGAGLTLAQQNFWNTTSTWAGFVANFNSNLNNTTTWAAYDANWVRNYNATTTLKDFTPSDYLSFTVWYSSTTREAMRLNGQVASYYTDATNLTVEVTDNWTGQFNGQASTYYATSSGLSTKLAVSEFETYFNSSLNTTTTLDLTTLAINNLTVNTTIALPNNSITDAMLANDITASNYLSLSSYFATTTWAGGNNNLVVSGNVTSTSLWLGGAGTA